MMWGHMDVHFRPKEAPTLVSKIKLAALIMLMEPVGFIFAAASRSSYGGAYFPANVPEYDINIVGIPVALFVFVVLGGIELTAFCYTSDSKRGTH